MMDYIISLREGTMDAWSGAILAMKQGKGMYWFRISKALLTPCSPTIDSVRRIHLRGLDYHCSGPESKRSASALYHGCHWVRKGEFSPKDAPISDPWNRDLAETFPNGEFVNQFRADWITQMIKETRNNREFSGRTIETARWAREQVKKQTSSGQGGGQIMT